MGSDTPTRYKKNECSMIHISLFSGIGGFELASEWMGWKNYVSCDINEFGNRVRQYYWPNAYHHKDIHTLTYDTINAELTARFGEGWRNDDIIITGGFPCQPYSQAGKRLGKDDERHLWPEMLRLIREVEPTYVVGENVRGLLTWNDGLVFEEVQADLEALSYEVQPFLLPAAGVNAPHERYRIWFVARRVTPNTNGSELGSNKRANVGTTKEIWREKKSYVPTKLCSDGIASDTNNAGTGKQLRTNRNGEAQNEEREKQPQPKFRACDRYVTNPESKRSERLQPCEQCEVSEQEQEQFRGGNCQNITTDTRLLGQAQQPVNPMGTEQLCEERNVTDTNGGRQSSEEHRKEKAGWFAEESLRGNWENFPTQPPVRSVYDGVSNAMVRNIKSEIYGQISERYTDQDLQEVWEAFQSEEVREEIGRLYKIYEPRVLLQTVQLCSSSNTDEKGVSAFSEKASEGILRKMRKYGKLANTPQGRELEKQFKKQFTNTLPYLSHEIALVTMEAERAARKFVSWHRNESIKSMGNAIVPQVAYQIFKAIEQTKEKI